ncbi:MAG: TIGR03936 family radical SAM-associated protein [Ruminococcus sp.]|nr:TIGR03936 family radical SAM-associated protein [Ruminococcus sp.]
MADMPLPKNQGLRLERFEYRLVYEKTGRARYISHLDLLRTFQRAFKRARIPLWYTQGFNPHAYLMFPLALPLGTDSRVEILDVALIEELAFDELRDRMNSSMPEGLKIVSAAKPVMKHTEIASAEYIVRLKSLIISPEEICERFEGFVSQEKIEVEKRTKKKGINLVDIKPHIAVLDNYVSDEISVLQLRLPAGSEFNLNTGVVIDAFAAYLGYDFDTVYTTRTKILTKTGENFM